jgi:hypothetical protein
MILSAKKIGFQLNAIISNHLEFQRVKSDEVELSAHVGAKWGLRRKE